MHGETTGDKMREAATITYSSNHEAGRCDVKFIKVFLVFDLKTFQIFIGNVKSFSCHS